MGKVLLVLTVVLVSLLLVVLFLVTAALAKMATVSDKAWERIGTDGEGGQEVCE